MVAAVMAGLGCAGRLASPDGLGAADARGVAIATAPAPSAEERYCAWYGSPGDDGVLYFGQAAFWSAMAAAGGDPEADLRRAGPQLVGRFDLTAERLLPPLPVGDASSRSGVWDVLAAPDGRIWFTTFFEAAGSVEPGTGRVRRLALGGGLNELAPGPDETVLATRYGSGTREGGDGEVIAIAPEGDVARRWPLDAAPGFLVAPKTPAWDPHRHVLWLTTDLLPVAEGADGAGEANAEDRHDAYRIEADGTVRVLAEPPELQFVAAGPDGTLYQALAQGSSLQLRVVPPPGGPPPRSLALDDAFDADVDFVQDIQPAGDGRVAVTRWSGRVDVLHSDGSVRGVRLPRPDPAGLYYTAVLHGDRLCATYCADVSVVCADAP